MVFQNRVEAGRALAGALKQYSFGAHPLVLGLPRGGVPVAAEVAKALHGELDVLVVRKLGVPWHDEVAMGAIASGGARVISDWVARTPEITPPMLNDVETRERAELARREQAFRGQRPPLVVAGREVIVVDDGAATGATMLAGIQALRTLNPKKIVVALPVASPDAAERLEAVADDVVCLNVPRGFRAVGQYYEDFTQTSDSEVIDLLKQHGTNASRH